MLPRSRREYAPSRAASPDAIDAVRIDGAAFGVRRHWFWPEFAQGWEETTWRFYRRFVDPRRPVLDLGCWIGPTVLFATACGAPRIVAVEANPPTVKHLHATRAANDKTRADLTIVHAAVHSHDGFVQFRNPDGPGATLSAASVRGTGFIVPSRTIRTIVRDHACAGACIVKIDIGDTSSRSPNRSVIWRVAVRRSCSACTRRSGEANQAATRRPCWRPSVRFACSTLAEMKS
jgi:FkbM family methyltransferase